MYLIIQETTFKNIDSIYHVVNFTNDMPDANYSMSTSLGTGLMATAAQQFPVTIGNDGGFNVGKGTLHSRLCDNDAASFAAADAPDICCAFFR